MGKTGNRFGIADPNPAPSTPLPASEDPLLSDLFPPPGQQATPPEQAPAPEQAPEPAQNAPVAPEAAGVAPEATPEANAGESTAPAPGTEPLIMGRYRTQDDLIAAYSNLQAAFTRSQQQNAQVSAWAQQVQQALDRAVPIIEEYQRQGRIPQQGQPAGAAPAPLPDPNEDPAAWAQAFAAQQAEMTRRAIEEARVQFQQANEQQFAQQQQYQAAQQMQQRHEAALAAYYQRHPEAGRGTPLETEVAQAANAYQIPLFEDDAFEFAHQLATNPTLAQAAFQAAQSAGLGWTQTREGRDWVRQMSGMTPVPAPAGAGAPGQAPAAPQAPARSRTAAYVEHGGSGAPTQGAPGGRTADEFDEVLRLAASDRARPAALTGKRRTT